VSGAVLISGLLFLLIPLTQLLDPVKKADLVVREVVLSPPPPQAPPPPEPAEPVEEPPPPELVQTTPPIEINTLDISVSTGTGDVIAIGVPSPDLVVQDIATEMERMFTFEDLEEPPRMINRPNFRFPPSLVRRGITSGRVNVEIDILPDGRAEFRRIVSLTHPELEGVARQILSRVRFTRPMVNGQPQQVRGVIPLNLDN
jgi:outer membrane biosynthesis protein TonB